MGSSQLQTWSQTALEELIASCNSDGGWPHVSGQASNAEPTALALLALAAFDSASSAIPPAVAWLQQQQLADGAFGLSSTYAEASWVTPLAAMALARLGRDNDHAVSGAAAYLLAEDVFTLNPTPPTYGYDTGTPGWPWMPGVYSFVEPTALALIFLKQQGYTQHERVREGVACLAARVIPSGGWNYGEPVVLDASLYATVAPTAAALLALVGEQSELTATAADWLAGQRGTITSLYSLAWAAMAMNVLGRESWSDDVAALWNATSMTRRNPLDTALCLLAVAPREGHAFALTD